MENPQEQIKTNPKDKQVYFLRHCEKISKITKEKLPNIRITKLGKKQSLVTGYFIADNLDATNAFPKNNSREVMVLVSPYLRCIETAVLVVHALKQKGYSIYRNGLFSCSYLKETQKGKLKITSEELQKDLEEWKSTNPS